MVAATSYAFRSLSLDEWAGLPEDDDRELVDGTLVDSEMPNSIHEYILTWLNKILIPWADSRGARLFQAGLKFGVTPERGRYADMSIFFAGRKRSPGKAAVHRLPPNIIVEIVSPSAQNERRDRVEKVGEYALFGVDWYWIIDPEWRTFEILERGTDGKYRHMLGVGEGVIDPVPGCPELTLDITALWRAVDTMIAESDGEE